MAQKQNPNNPVVFFDVSIGGEVKLAALQTFQLVRRLAYLQFVGNRTNQTRAVRRHMPQDSRKLSVSFNDREKCGIACTGDRERIAIADLKQL